MAKIAVVYWSGTGNTAAMASTIAKGATESGAEATLFNAVDFTPDKVAQFDAIAFGCPSMGDEILEEDEFEPMYVACKPLLNGKRIGLFGSYDWGNGEWMAEWEADCDSVGAIRVAPSIICTLTPDGTANAACKALGNALAG